MRRLSHLITLSLALLVACGATRQGRVGVEYEKKTPAGDFRGKVKAHWDFNAPDDSWCGCITFLGEDGKPMPDTPKGEIRGGRGGGVVPKGAVGWKVEITDDCEGFSCDEPDKKNETGAGRASSLTAAQTWMMFGSYQGFNFTDTPMAPTQSGRFYEYALTVQAPNQAGARATVDQLLNDRTQGFPTGVEVHEFLDLSMRVDPLTGLPQGWTGEFLDDEPMDFLALSMNGQVVDAHFGQSPYSGLGYWAYPVSIAASSLNVDITYNSSFSNLLRKQWIGDQGHVDQGSNLTWTTQ